MPKATSKQTKGVVISYRITEKQEAALKKSFKDNGPILGVKTSKRYAAKLLGDFLAERLVFKNPKHAKKDVESYPDPT